MSIKIILMIKKFVNSTSIADYQKKISLILLKVKCSYAIFLKGHFSGYLYFIKNEE